MTNKPRTIKIAIPRDLCKESGLTLVELLIYSAILSVILLTVYQARTMLMQMGYRTQNTSQAVMQASRAIDRLKTEVGLTEIPIKIVNQSQPANAPTGSDQGNCIEMSKTVLGIQTTYSVASRYDDASKAFGLYYLKSNGCTTTATASNAEAISSNIFALTSGKNFFTPFGNQENGGYREVNFNFQTSAGKGSFVGGQAASVERLTATTPTHHVCRVASPDKSWFTDFSQKKIRTATVSITLNLDATNDRLGLTGSHSNVIATNFNSIGVLNLYASDGLTVSDWLTLLSDVIYFQADGAPTITEANPPKRITFTLGPGLSYTPAGVPSTHFYLAMKLDSAKNFNDASNLAASFCYPSFTDDSNSHFLGQGATTAGTSCNSGNYPRLTGYLPTLTTEGEHVFMQSKVLNTIYPQTVPSSGNFTNTTTATTGQLWLGGHFGGSLTGSGSGDFYRWIKGFELSKDNDINQNHFANNLRNALQGDAAGFYYTSLFSNSSTTSGHKMFFDISGSNSKFWNAQDGTNTTGYFVVEFGDNRNAGGGTNTGDEISLNSNIRLKKDITVVPFEFFKTCQ